MSAHKVETVLTEDGKLVLQDLPFQAGETVQVMIIKQTQSHLQNRYLLRGKQPYQYDQPFEAAVPEEDWEVLQ